MIPVDEPGPRAGRAAGPSPKPWAPPSVRRLLERLALIGAVPGDSDEVRVQKVTLTLAAVIVRVLSVIWRRRPDPGHRGDLPEPARPLPVRGAR
jgi:hypothetical protein